MYAIGNRHIWLGAFTAHLIVFLRLLHVLCFIYLVFSIFTFTFCMFWQYLKYKSKTCLGGNNVKLTTTPLIVENLLICELSAFDILHQLQLLIFHWLSLLFATAAARPHENKLLSFSFFLIMPISGGVLYSERANRLMTTYVTWYNQQTNLSLWTSKWCYVCNFFLIGIFSSFLKKYLVCIKCNFILTANIQSLWTNKQSYVGLAFALLLFTQYQKYIFCFFFGKY